VLVGFAAETNADLAQARAKRAAKGVDLLVLNDVLEPGAGFESETNRVTLLHRSGQAEPLPLMSKEAVAHQILDRVVQLLATSGPTS